MAGLFDTLAIGKSAIFYNQIQMNVTAHNIANAATRGYSRQRVLSGTNPSKLTPGGLIGMGVRVDDIIRQRDQYIDRQVLGDRATYSYSESQYGTMTRVEGILNETSEYSISTALDEFWNAWSSLSLNPGEVSYRNEVLTKTNQLCNQFHAAFQSLEQCQDDLVDEIENTTHTINFLAEQIATLNTQICQAEAGTTMANDLRDARDQIVDELSRIADVSVSYNGSGTVTVRLGTEILLNDATARALETERHTEGDMVGVSVQWADSKVEPVFSGGSLKAKIDLVDTYLPELVDDFNTLAATIIDQVNALHEGGYALDGETTGLDFFTGEGAHDIGVNAQLSRDVTLIAASRSEGDGMDNGNALAIFGLKETTVMTGRAMTMNEFYSSLVFRVGLDTQESMQTRQNAEVLLNHSLNLQDSVSGVNLDEEMIELIKFQNAYDAAAQVIDTVDEMLDTLINTIG